jgi:Tol biopolymer transport system component
MVSVVSSPVAGRANAQRFLTKEVDMSPVFTRTLALTLATLVSAAACSDGDGPTQPRRTPAEVSLAKQSTTSSKMLFYDFYNIWIMNDDGTNALALGVPADQSFDPSWAPDGKRVLFNSFRGEPETSIYVMNADGTGVTRITSPPTLSGDIRPVAFGKRVAFVRHTGGTSSVYRVNLDGSDLTPIAPGLQPASSPGGAKLAFVNNGDIFEYDAATGLVRNLTNTPAVSESDPSYSPNGKQIAFASRQIAGNVLNTISVMLVDGTAVTRLIWSTTDGYDLPKWSPDGKRIAFTLAANGAFSTDIHVMNVDGTGVTNLTNSPAVTELLTAWAR